MHIVKVLKRKDASSLIISIVLALQLQQLLGITTYRFSNWLANIGNTGYQTNYGVNNGGWRSEYANPVATVVVQVIALELFIRLFVWVHPMLVSKKKK